MRSPEIAAPRNRRAVTLLPIGEGHGAHPTMFADTLNEAGRHTRPVDARRLLSSRSAAIGKVVSRFGAAEPHIATVPRSERSRRTIWSQAHPDRLRRSRAEAAFPPIHHGLGFGRNQKVTYLGRGFTPLLPVSQTARNSSKRSPSPTPQRTPSRPKSGSRRGYRLQRLGCWRKSQRSPLQCRSGSPVEPPYAPPPAPGRQERWLPYATM